MGARTSGRTTASSLTLDGETEELATLTVAGSAFPLRFTSQPARRLYESPGVIQKIMGASASDERWCRIAKAVAHPIGLSFGPTVTQTRTTRRVSGTLALDVRSFHAHIPQG